MLEALIFDVDGTLAETEEAHRVSFNRAFAEAGLDCEWDVRLYAELLQVTGGKERMRAYFAGTAHGQRDADELEALVVSLHRRKTALFGDLVRAGDLVLRPGIRDLIGSARAAGIKLAIATTTNRLNVDALLQATLGADGLAAFEVIVAGDDVAAKKPAPDVYLQVIRMLRVPAARCLALEDSSNGSKAALRAGIPVVITRSAFMPDDRFDGVLAVLHDLGELGGTVDRGPAILSAIRDLHARAAAA